MSSSRQRTILLFLLFFFSGLTSLVYEIVWSRILSTIIGNTSLAIAVVVSLFMLGLALGSFVSARLKRSFKPLMLYAFLEGLIGFYSLFTPNLSEVISRLYS
ncbi:MAG TPA: spermine synthase, partial [Acidobacteriota bacterium]|nr:spermine synthase [Acidobacteriota bacterium]